MRKNFFAEKHTTIILNATIPVSLYKQLYDGLRSAIPRGQSSATSQNIPGQQTCNPLLISPRLSLLHLLNQWSKALWERTEQVQLALLRVRGDSFNLRLGSESKCI